MEELRWVVICEVIIEVLNSVTNKLTNCEHDEAKNCREEED